MKARVIATGKIIEVVANENYYDTTDNKERYYHHELDFNDTTDYWTRLEHQYAGMAMQGLLSNPSITENKLITREGIVEDAERLAHALVKKVRYEENPKELEGLKKELEALKIEKTILENKIKLLKEERK